MNYADHVFTKLNSHEKRILELECKIFKLVSALEFIKSMDLNSVTEQTVPQILHG
jgi:hypothetical protein